MQGIEAITAEILSAAKSQAEETVKKAEDFKAARLAELENRLSAEQTNRAEQLVKESENVISRRLTLAGLEARMAKLGAKQSVVSDVYALSLKKAAAWEIGKYRAFFARLISAFSSDGDSISVALSDVKRLDKAWLDDVSAQSGKKLTLLRDTVNASGGVVIEGKNSETDLTLESLISEIREQSESEVLAALFGETK